MSLLKIKKHFVFFPLFFLKNLKKNFFVGLQVLLTLDSFFLFFASKKKTNRPVPLALFSLFHACFVWVFSLAFLGCDHAWATGFCTLQVAE